MSSQLVALWRGRGQEGSQELWVLCHMCPGGAERGAKGRREVAWRGLWGLFWAILLYSDPLSPIQGSVGLQSSRERHPLAASRGAAPGAGGGVAGSRGGRAGAARAMWAAPW